MCGIAGCLWEPGTGAGQNAEARVRAMTAAIAHRGPDSHGHWLDASAGVALGHRRLAILDLSSAGHQPMISADSRYQIVFNGEIYNHLEIRAELQALGRAPSWRGHSDTETLLAGIVAWGLEATLVRCVGMFGIALWDRKTRVLQLARDRLGEKPLYFGWQGQGAYRAFLFGSELKALRAHFCFEGRIRRASVMEMLRYNYVPDDMVIYEGLWKLRPGEMAELSFADAEPRRWQYWDGARLMAEGGKRVPMPSTDEAVDQLEALLKQAVGQQMMADVPLGAFLSGGIDSSTVVGLMAHLSDAPLHTFSIGFHEKNYDEATFAAKVARHLGTHHTELYVGDRDLRDVIPRLPQIYDEPFGDSSQIPTFLVAELARRHVTVALSGDGGDELFCGYDRYAQGSGFWAQIQRLPQWLRAGLSGALQTIPYGVYDAALEPLRNTRQGKEPNGQRIHRLADYLRADSLEDLNRKMVSFWRAPEMALANEQAGQCLLTSLLPPRGALTDLERMMQLSMVAYLPDDILTKVDRATMAVGLESRAPLLDHRVVEFALSLPPEYKLRAGTSKWLLRQVLYRHVPKELVERPKQGFEVPIGLWLREGLRDWAEALLETRRLRSEGLFNAPVIRQMWSEHQTGRCNWGNQLWNVLMVQAWREAQTEIPS
jgi:asparagine synthase (glutamine-hydrolysing)